MDANRLEPLVLSDVGVVTPKLVARTTEAVTGANRPLPASITVHASDSKLNRIPESHLDGRRRRRLRPATRYVSKSSWSIVKTEKIDSRCARCTIVASA
jgi:hypothetical protein